MLVLCESSDSLRCLVLSRRGDPLSPKRSGGLWPMVTVTALGVAVAGIVSNIWSLTMYNEAQEEFTGEST